MQDDIYVKLSNQVCGVSYLNAAASLQLDRGLTNHRLCGRQRGHHPRPGRHHRSPLKTPNSIHQNLSESSAVHCNDNLLIKIHDHQLSSSYTGSSCYRWVALRTGDRHNGHIVNTQPSWSLTITQALVLPDALSALAA